MFKLELSLKRIQTFIFEVPRLKAMLGANAIVGETMRHELPKLLQGKGAPLPWPNLRYNCPEDPLTGTDDPDNPVDLYKQGILARDGGHFIAVFEEESAAKEFLKKAEEKIAAALPGVLYEAKISVFPPEKDEKRSAKEPKKPKETHFLDLPVLQVCQETGKGPASRQGEKKTWQSSSVIYRFKQGKKFYEGGTKDIVGLMRPLLYPEQKIEKDLENLAARGYLALIHADGNGIGKRYTTRQSKWEKEPLAHGTPFDRLIAKEAYGEAFFHSMRVAVRRSVVDALKNTFPEQKDVPPYDILMLGGDDLLLVCRADYALQFAIHYATELKKYKLADGDPLDVAIGIAIAKHRYPLNRLHELAESLASSAKKLSRAYPEEKASVIDWQVVTQSWFQGVAEARQQSEQVTYQLQDGKKETLLLTGRPYRVLGEKESLESLYEAAGTLDGAARSALRSLRRACEQGRLAGEMVFKKFPESVQTVLRNKLWDEDPKYPDVYLTRALDIIGIREITHLGKKRNGQ